MSRKKPRRDGEMLKREDRGVASWDAAGWNYNCRLVRRPLGSAGRSRWLGLQCLRGQCPPAGKGATHGPVGVPLPSDDLLRPIHEKGGKPTDPVAQDLPEAGQGLRIQDANHHLLAMDGPRIANPLGQADVLRLEILRVLVDLLRMDLLAYPRPLQERLAVGSVVEPCEDRRDDFDDQWSHGKPPALDFLPTRLTMAREPPRRRPGAVHPARLGPTRRI